MSAGITTERVRALAQNWSWWNSGGPDSLPPPRPREQALANIDTMLEKCVTKEGLDALLAWVRERMADVAWSGLGSDPESRCEFAYFLAQDFDWPHEGPDEDTLAWALCEQAGWPS